MSRDTDEQLIQKWGQFANTWVEYLAAEKTKTDMKNKLTPDQFDSWLDWMQESQRRLDAREGNAHGPNYGN